MIAPLRVPRLRQVRAARVGDHEGGGRPYLHSLGDLPSDPDHLRVSFLLRNAHRAATHLAARRVFREIDMKRIVIALLLLVATTAFGEVVKRGATIAGDAKVTALADVVAKPDTFKDKTVVVEG